MSGNNHTDTGVKASGGEGTAVNSSVQGAVTNSEEAAPQDKAPNKMTK